jgi:hypothetical protein
VAAPGLIGLVAVERGGEASAVAGPQLLPAGPRPSISRNRHDTFVEAGRRQAGPLLVVTGLLGRPGPYAERDRPPRGGGCLPPAARVEPTAAEQKQDHEDDEDDGEHGCLS